MRSTEAGFTALQANLNQMLDTLRDGVLLFTADRRAVMVSDAVAYFINRPQGELVGRQLEEIFEPETALGAAVLAAFADGESGGAESVTIEDGRRVQVSLDRFNDEMGASMGTLITLRDLESMMQLGQELEISRRLAAIGRLTAGVGHEVKNPINAMVVHLELLRSKLAGAGQDPFGGAQRHVDILTGEMQRLDRVVQTLADFSRPMELKLREHDLRQVVNAVVDLTAAEMQENGVLVGLSAPEEPLMIRVDAELVRQALLNLLLNGMQAMPQGGNLSVTLRRDHQFAVVEVTDEGEGIPPEILPRIFELYFTTKPKGSGIGLAMTYRILQMHGGALDVRSNATPLASDRGTTFTLRLPMAAGSAAETRKTASVGLTRSSRGMGEHV
jgi:signal transduction histidine kinase